MVDGDVGHATRRVPVAWHGVLNESVLRTGI